jgi:hypothetical protein
MERIPRGNDTKDQRAKEGRHECSNDSCVDEILAARGDPKGRVVARGEVGVVGVDGRDASKDELAK